MKGKALTCALLTTMLLLSLPFLASASTKLYLRYDTFTTATFTDYDLSSNMTSLDITVDLSGLTHNATVSGYFYCRIIDVAGASQNGTRLGLVVAASTEVITMYVAEYDKSSTCGDLTSYTVGADTQDTTTFKWTVRNAVVTMYVNGSAVGSPASIPTTLADNGGYQVVGFAGLANMGWTAGVCPITYGASVGSVITDYLPLLIILPVVAGLLGVIAKKR